KLHVVGSKAGGTGVGYRRCPPPLPAGNCIVIPPFKVFFLCLAVCRDTRTAVIRRGIDERAGSICLDLYLVASHVSHRHLEVVWRNAVVSERREPRFGRLGRREQLLNGAPGDEQL